MSTPSAPAGHPRHFSDRLPSLAEVGPLIALVLACAFFISQSSRFLSFQNLSLILQQTMVVAVIAIGQTLIVLTGGIDLSCGMVMAFGSIIMTKFAVTLGLPPAVAILCGIAASTLFGVLNGVLITRIKLPAFIVTLGTLNIAFALTHGHLQNVISTRSSEGDTNLSYLEFPVQQQADGYGCDYHPSAATNAKMATLLTAQLKTRLGW